MPSILAQTSYFVLSSLLVDSATHNWFLPYNRRPYNGAKARVVYFAMPLDAVHHEAIVFFHVV